LKRDFKRKQIRRTKHFKRKNPLTFKDVVSAIKISLKIAAALGLVFFSGVLCEKAYQKLEDVSYFHIKRIAFKGCVKSNEDDLYELSGVNKKSSMFFVDLKNLAQKIEKHSWVKDVSVKKRMPDKLFIGVKEREPIAMINLDTLYYVDEGGIIFKKLEKGDDTDFPVITGLDKGSVFNKKNRNSKRLIARAINLIDMLKERDLFSDKDISEINLDAERGVTLFTYDNAMPIKVGFEFSHDRFDKLLRVFEEIREMALKAEYIDIDYDERVVVKVAANI
jgi:cell division protein FtsQ